MRQSLPSRTGGAWVLSEVPPLSDARALFLTPVNSTPSGVLAPGSGRQQFGFAAKMDAAAPVPEARSEASHVPFSMDITAVRLGGGEGPRWMTTVTLPFAPSTADNALGAFHRPFCVPLMYSQPHPPGPSLK